MAFLDRQQQERGSLAQWKLTLILSLTRFHLVCLSPWGHLCFFSSILRFNRTGTKVTPKLCSVPALGSITKMAVQNLRWKCTHGTDTCLPEKTRAFLTWDWGSMWDAASSKGSLPTRLTEPHFHAKPKPRCPRAACPLSLPSASYSPRHVWPELQHFRHKPNSAWKS